MERIGFHRDVDAIFFLSLGLCALAQPWEGFIIGAVGALVGLAGISGLDRLHIDDPVGAFLFRFGNFGTGSGHSFVEKIPSSRL